ncbi:hypothetical protein LIER_31117 [Lithospermum erythrorhizon]|uniref:Reverse transcriptase zinc-binding domain-containing protein n=1 Tax=Lithospermum erythrorhizon TaxID=34254 RepID=A0AAV3RQ06_LITER
MRWRVSQLIRDGAWREDVIKELFAEDDVKQILAIPSSKFHVRDKLVWHHIKSGIYITSSGYKSARELKKNGELRSNQMGECSSRNEDEGELWRNLWGLRIPPRVRNFIWRCTQ